MNPLNIFKNTGSMKKQFKYQKKDVVLNHHGLSDHISKAIHKRKFYELTLLEYIASLKIKGNYIDVGANIGNHSVFFSMFCDSDKVYSFEPEPSNFTILHRNILDNNLEHKTNVYNFGLGSSDKKAHSVVNQKNYGSTYLKDDEYGNIEIINANDIFKGTKIDVLKIDAESMSFEIFKTLETKIKKDKPLLIIEAEKDELVYMEKSLNIKHHRVFNATPTYVFKF